MTSKAKKPYVITTLYLMLHSRLKMTLIIITLCPFISFYTLLIVHIIVITNKYSTLCFTLVLQDFKVNNKIQEEERKKRKKVEWFFFSLIFQSSTMLGLG